MMELIIKNKYMKMSLILLLSIMLILFTHSMKLLFHPGSVGSISLMTVAGLGSLWLFSLIGLFIGDLANKLPIGFVANFPVLGWVSITSLTLCLLFDGFVQAIQAVDFLSITTPILTYAGISVADRLVELRKLSWKIAIVAIFVFTGTYLASAVLAEVGLRIAS